MAFQHVPTLQSTGRLRLTPPSTWFSRMLAYAYFPLLPSVPPALLVEATDSWCNRFFVLGVLCMLFGIYHPRFRLLPSVQAAEPW